MAFKHSTSPKNYSIEVSSLTHGEKLQETMTASHETLVPSASIDILYITSKQTLPNLNIALLKTLDYSVPSETITSTLIKCNSNFTIQK